MIELSAPAKINLFLYVLGRREDGYHELVTRMQKIALCDKLIIRTTDKPGVELHCSKKDLPTDDNNLAVIAAQRFLKTAGLLSLHGLQIHLEKNIPISAGLGGGSSDATEPGWYIEAGDYTLNVARSIADFAWARTFVVAESLGPLAGEASLP